MGYAGTRREDWIRPAARLPFALFPAPARPSAHHLFPACLTICLQFLIRTRQQAVNFFGPSDTTDQDETCYGFKHRKHQRGADEHTYYLKLPMELLFCPTTPGNSDVLHLHCHMFKMHFEHKLWDTHDADIGDIE